MLRRQPLQTWGPLTVPEDTLAALAQIEAFAAHHKCKIRYEKAPGFDLNTAGRAVQLTFVERDGEVLSREIAERVMWSLAVPCGFTPHDRYLVSGSESSLVFNHLGIWRPLHDRLLGEGRGDLLWPSLLNAARADVGKLESDREVEIFIQAQLHRIGFNCGPVDGIIGPRTVECIKQSGLSGLELSEVAKILSEQKSGRVRKQENPGKGHIILPNHEFTVTAVGEVSSIRITDGASLIIRGPGRVILDIAGESKS